MNPLVAAVADWGREVARAWDRFWFTRQEPQTLSLIRILGGAMLFYTHLIWSLDLEAFLGSHAWLTADTVALMNRERPDAPEFAWSYLSLVQSPVLLWSLHIAGLVVFAMLTAGLYSRITSILACVITLAYCNRLTGAWFGLDQINAFIAMYLMLGDCAGAYSLDRWLAARRDNIQPPQATIGTNISMRLLQVHMCVIYLFGGIGKMQGDAWWDGSATWMSIASLEYQSIDVTWMVRYRWLLALMTHITVFWETFYCFLVWPKLTRPIVLALAVMVHGGIALFLGMKTFGLAMIVGNLVFVSPQFVHAVVTWLCRMPRGAAPTSAAARGESPASRRQSMMVAS